MFAEGFPRGTGIDQSARATQRDDSVSHVPLQDATGQLERRFPEFSASTGPNWLQIAAFVTWLASALAGLFDFGGANSWLYAAPMMLPFAGLVLIRLLVLRHAIRPSSKPISVAVRVADHKLPAFTVLVPVFRESQIAAQLVRALAALDYPTAKLQILFLAEACDEPTQAALQQAGLAAHMHLIVVPHGTPRTKPRALNFGLGLATGDYITVYDAEDEPDRDQLRRVASAFRNGASNLGCVQCRLKIYNAHQTWLTRQFAIEYAALFDLVLPTFARLGLPITLGGTSNHFPGLA